MDDITGLMVTWKKGFLKKKDGLIPGPSSSSNGSEKKPSVIGRAISRFLPGSSKTIKYTTKPESTTIEVLYRCPELDENSVLPKGAWMRIAHSKINEIKQTDPIRGCIMEIKSCNPESRVSSSIGMISLLIQRIITYPKDKKYRTIKMGSELFNENVMQVSGALDLLQELCFDVVRDKDEDFIVFRNGTSVEDLNKALDALSNIPGFQYQLDRDVKISINKEPIALKDLHKDFFNMERTRRRSADYYHKRDVQLRKDVLVSRSMRDLWSKRRAAPAFTRIQVFLPNDTILVGTFSFDEKLRNVREFVNEYFEVYANCSLQRPPKQKFDKKDEEKTLEHLDLVPTAELRLVTTEREKNK